MISWVSTASARAARRSSSAQVDVARQMKV
jgi:hypothetical protein